MISPERIQLRNSQSIQSAGRYVLYWMTAARRRRHNPALERAVHWCRELSKPLVVLEPLRVGYRWASDRFHGFVIAGMQDHVADFDVPGVRYYPYVEREPGEGTGLLEELAASAAVVIADDYPCFFLPQMVSAAAAKVEVRFEAVDGNGLYPMRATDRVFTVAHSFRRHLQKKLPLFLSQLPEPDPLEDSELPPAPSLPKSLLSRWPVAGAKLLRGDRLAELPIDHSVGTTEFDGGAAAGRRRLDEFFDGSFTRYENDRNQPSQEVTSRLSPYLHFGHVSAFEVFERLTAREDWSPDVVAGCVPNGQRHGFWGMSPLAEEFLDQFVTWRELGFNGCVGIPGYDAFGSLPPWAQTTLAKHAGDPREYTYTLDQFEAGETHDPLWNAAQSQLRSAGRIHNYLRMLWGKKILEWSGTPEEALEVMIELNNKFALDGRDPNSYSGIFWVLGRYDRAWGPERPVFGKVRFMSSANTARKVRVTEYLAQWS